MAATTLVIPASIEHDADGQFIKIPQEFVLPGDNVTITQDATGRLVVESTERRTRNLADLIASWQPLGEEDSFPEIEDMPPEPVNI